MGSFGALGVVLCACSAVQCVPKRRGDAHGVQRWPRPRSTTLSIGGQCVCLVGWQRVVVRGVVVFVLKDGMEQRDGGGVRGFVWSFCRALVVVVVVKQPVCFCVCVWPWQGAGGVLGLLLGTGGGGAQQRLFCGVLWCVLAEDRGQRTEEGGKKRCVPCVCVVLQLCVFLPSPKVMWMDGWMDGW